MVVRIELDDPNIGWTQYGPSDYILEKMKAWLVKYVWNRDKLSKYERSESLYIVGPSKIGKTDTCYNLLNKNGAYCKVFVIDTYTNWQAFHDYVEQNGLPDFVLVDELGRGWKNIFGGQKTITYALNSKNKITIEYGRPCIYLCNPDSDVFNDRDFSSSKRSWLEDNLFGGEPIYLKQNFINGASVKEYNRFAGNIKWRNIDPEIRKYIGFGSKEFESFPMPVQNRFLDEATGKYISKLRNIDPEIRKHIGFESKEFKSFPIVVQDKFLGEATDKYISELRNREFGNLGLINRITEKDGSRLCVNDSFYYNAADDGLCRNDIDSSTDTDESGVYYGPADEFYAGAADACGSNVHDNVSDKSYAEAADAYVDWYMQNY
jgi:hypothetical protein